MTRRRFLLTPLYSEDAAYDWIFQEQANLNRRLEIVGGDTDRVHRHLGQMMSDHISGAIGGSAHALQMVVNLCRGPRHDEQAAD